MENHPSGTFIVWGGCKNFIKQCNDSQMPDIVVAFFISL